MHEIRRTILVSISPSPQTGRDASPAVDPTYPQTALLVRLAVERVAADPADEQRYLELHFALDRAVERNLRYRELLALFAEGAMSAAPEVSWAWRLAAGLGSNLMGDSAAAIRWLHDAEQELAHGGRLNTAAAAFVFGELARAEYHYGEHAAGLEAANRALQLARSANSPLAEAYAHHYLGLISLRQRDFEYARRHIVQSLELFEWMNQRQGRARVLDSMASLQIEQGQYDAARRLLEESLVVKEELRDLRGQALTCSNLAQIFIAHGDYPQAMLYLDRTRALVSRVGDERNATLLRVRVGELHLRHGNPERACDELESARQLAVDRHDARLEAHACFALAEARGQIHDHAGALEAAKRAYDYFAASDDTVMRDRAALRQALVQGEDLASPTVTEPLERLRALEAGAPLAEALFETATSFRNRGRAQQVIALYAEALDVAEPVLADQFAAIMRSRAESAEARAWVDAMLMVKRHKDRLEDAYERLQRAETLRESLTQMIVHDLKNPLTAILPWLETIQTGALTQDEVEEALQTVIDECGYLLRMIEDLNDVGKSQVGNRIELVCESVHLDELLQIVADRLQGRARESGMTIRVDPLPPLPVIQADREKMRRVIENLIANGIKYGRPAEGSPLPPEVTVRAAIEPPGPGRGYETVRVEVCDNGVGIPLAEADRVFEAYYQAEAGRRRKAGVGLGLAFCRMVIEAHGGSIWTQPNPDGGSLFLFRLPLTATS